MKIRKFIKKNMKMIVAFILGLIISGGGVYAATVAASDVSYSPPSESELSSNVQDSIDELYSMSRSYKYYRNAPVLMNIYTLGRQSQLENQNYPRVYCYQFNYYESIEQLDPGNSILRNIIYSNNSISGSNALLQVAFTLGSRGNLVTTDENYIWKYNRTSYYMCVSISKQIFEQYGAPLAFKFGVSNVAQNCCSSDCSCTTKQQLNNVVLSACESFTSTTNCN